MNPLARLEGRSCAYYLRRHCTRTSSPTASEQALCPLQQERRRLGAQALDRLHRLQRLADPGQRETARRHLMDKNLADLARLECPHFVPTADGQICRQQYLVYCLRLLPLCPGRCPEYLARRAEGGQACPEP